MHMIDAHCHIGQGRYKKQTVQELLHSMDENNIAQSVIVPVEEYIAFDNETGNAEMLSAVKESGGRLIAFAAVNPWSGQKGIDMVKRYLDKGFKGVKLNTSLCGLFLFDEPVVELIEAVKGYDLPVYAHTGTPMFALPLHLRELALLFPTVNFICGHMASYDYSQDLQATIAGLSNIYLETSMSLSNLIKGAVAFAGEDHVIFGSNAPRSTQGFELENVRRAVQDKDVLEKILGGNIRRLIGG